MRYSEHGFRGWRGVVAAGLVACLLGAATACGGGVTPEGAAQTSASPAEHWVGTWSTALYARPAVDSLPPAARALIPDTHFSNQTLRQIVRASIGGQRVRVVLSNTAGTAPLEIGAAHVGLRAKEHTLAANSGRQLTFSGNPGMTIPPGAVIFSDPVDLAVPPLGEIAVDIYIPGDTAGMKSPITTHTLTGALQTNYVSPTGNHAGAVDMPVASTTRSWFFLSRVEVMAPEQTGAIVALGDSITAGSQSTPDTNNRWPDHLAPRLNEGNVPLGVLNVGISGNRLLRDQLAANALARFERDVLAQSGATHVVLLEGINDIGQDASAAEIIAAYRQLIERAHTAGLKIYGATILPFEGAATYTAAREATRKAVNDFIRTGNAFDGVIDFDAALRDPGQPTRMLPKFAAADNLHPNDAGYQAMGQAIDLELF